MKNYHLVLKVKRFGEVEEYSVNIMARDESELRESINFWKALVNADDAEAILVA